MQPQPAPSRFKNLGLFLMAGVWVVIASRMADSAASGLGGHIPFIVLQPLLEPVFLLFLLLTGLTAIALLGNRTSGLRQANLLPKRPTGREERQRGFALGWAIALLAVLPMLLTGALHPEFWLGPRNWLPTLVAVSAIALGTLAAEIAFRGYLFSTLIAAVGQVTATIVVSLIYALAAILHPNSGWLSMAVAFTASLLLCIACLRTHALWVSWGLHFGWAAATAILLGLPTAGDASLCTLVTTSVSGPTWLTGGPYGPDAALLTLAIHLLALIPLYRLTRDYAWRYTHAEIVPAGIPVVIAPPAAHTAMEAESAAKPAPLVQILATTPANSSTMPMIEEHLRREPDAPSGH